MLHSQRCLCPSLFPISSVLNLSSSNASTLACWNLPDGLHDCLAITAEALYNRTQARGKEGAIIISIISGGTAIQSKSTLLRPLQNASLLCAKGVHAGAVSEPNSSCRARPEFPFTLCRIFKQHKLQYWLYLFRPLGFLIF